MPRTETEFPSTHFAITSVNVPDRLDQREVDDRKQQDEMTSLYAERRLHLLTWVRRLAPYLLLAALIVLAVRWLAEQRDAFGPKRIAQQLSWALKVPVQVQDTRFRSTPAPGIVISGVDLNGRIHLDSVVLEFTAPNLWQALVSGRRRWGDIVISPTVLSLDQASEMLTWLQSLDSAVPDAATRVRISELRLTGSKLLAGRFEAIARRESDGHFSSVSLRTLDGPGSMQLQLTPDRASGTTAFQCDAADWRPPFPPGIAWSEIVASGHVSDGAVDIDKFSLGAAFGALEGQISVRRQGDATAPWLATGRAGTVGLDIATLIQLVTKQPEPAEGAPAPTPPMSGTAALEAAISGTGASLDQTIEGLVAAGEVKIRGAVLNGINLGYAASRPSETGAGNGASTRFTQFDASFVGGQGAVFFRKVHGAAGALSTHGELGILPGLALEGLMHVDLGGTRVQAPLRIHVRGTVDAPTFGR